MKSSSCALHVFTASVLTLSLVGCQIVPPASVLDALESLEAQQHGFRSIKAAVRSTWLTQLSSHTFGEHTDKRDLTSSHSKQVQPGRSTARLEFDVNLIFNKLYAAGPSIECQWDDTMLLDYKVMLDTKYLLAANFRDNQDVLPHIIREIWRFISLLPSHNLFVSIYESGSKDTQTASWLEVLSKILALSGVQHQIITGGALIRGEDEGRVNFLAQVRNKALEPLWRLANSSAPSSSKLLRGHANGIQPWKADRIIFMNDVFVCARDFARLLLHDADMACALDFGDRDQADESEGKQSIQEKQLQFLTYDTARRRLKDIHIYDKWVLRDTDGHMVDSKPPYEAMHSGYTRERLLAGLPFPVTSCWNGLVVMTAKPFLDGLRFRSHVEEECRASECSLVCHDFRRLNYTRIIVDPGVQLGYERYDAAGLYISDIVGNIKRTLWDDLRGAPAINSTLYERDSEICCNLDELNWADNPLRCSMRNFLEPNYTRIAFPEL